MSYFAPYLDDGGIHVPSYQERLDGLIAGYRQIFGEDVYIEPDSMDYQLLSLVAKCWDDLNSVVIDSYYARNPNFASGSALDMLLPLNGMMRKPATKSSVTLSLTGYPETTMDAGKQAMDADGNIWEIPTSVAFGADGKATAVAYCTVPGPVAAGVGTITIINTPDRNWIDVTNETIAILGNAVETDAQVRLRRAQNLARESQNTVSGIRAELVGLPGIKSVNVLENPTGLTLLNPAMTPHSILVVVSGGDDDQVAEMIWRKKSPGCDMNGDVEVTYTDEYNNDNLIKFYHAVENPAKITIVVRKFDSCDPTLFSVSIPAAVAAYVNGLGINDNLILSMLNSVIYNANTSGRPVFSVSSITGDATGIVAETDTMFADYKTMFTCDGTAVTVTEVVENTIYKIEVG